jgi:hypothetical protein
MAFECVLWLQLLAFVLVYGSWRRFGGLNAIICLILVASFCLDTEYFVRILVGDGLDFLGG